MDQRAQPGPVLFQSLFPHFRLHPAGLIHIQIDHLDSFLFQAVQRPQHCIMLCLCSQHCVFRLQRETENSLVQSPGRIAPQSDSFRTANSHQRRQFFPYLIKNIKIPDSYSSGVSGEIFQGFRHSRSHTLRFRPGSSRIIQIYFGFIIFHLSSPQIPLSADGRSLYPAESSFLPLFFLKLSCTALPETHASSP